MDNTKQSREIATKSAPISSYIKKHWFQLIMIGFTIFVFIKKDFSFQLNMNNPSQIEQEAKPLHLLMNRMLSEMIAETLTPTVPISSNRMDILNKEV